MMMMRQCRRPFVQISALVLHVVAVVAVLAYAAPAIAQEFAKVDDAAREQLPATPFIGLAYGFIWLALLGYLFVLARRLGRVQGELQDLKRRLTRAEPGAASRG